MSWTTVLEVVGGVATGLLYTCAVMAYGIGVFIGTQRLGAHNIEGVRRRELLTRWMLFWMSVGYRRGMKVKKC